MPIVKLQIILLSTNPLYEPRMYIYVPIHDNEL